MQRGDSLRHAVSPAGRPAERLTDRLTSRGIEWHPVPGGVEVSVAGERAAASLLHELATDGIPITTFAPSHGALEAAYLAATEDRQ